MEARIKTPEELLKYRPLREILAEKGTTVYSVGAGDTVYAAVTEMAARNVGFLVVLEQRQLVGVLSERDYARNVILKGRSSSDTAVRDIMTRDVVTATRDDTLPRCMTLMHDRGIRHLPVVDEGRSVIGVLSVRDLLREVIAHHERVIRDLELERMTMMSGGSTY